MNTETRIQRPNAARLARFDATRVDMPPAEYQGRHHTTEDLDTRLISLPHLATPAQVPVPLPQRAPGAAMQQLQETPPQRRTVGILAKLRNSLGRFRP